MKRRTLRLWSSLALVLVALLAVAWGATPALAGDGDDDDDDLARVYGTLTSFPAGGGAGTWVVGDRTFTADGDTEFEQDEGSFAPGVCVKVEYAPATPTMAEKIETEPAGDCDGDDDDDDGPGRGDGDGDRDDDDNEIEYYGLIVSMPEGKRTGTWVVGDRTFTADGDTEFEQERGGFAVGVCVEVEADTATPTVAEKIETEPAYKCRAPGGGGGGGGDDDDDDRFDGEFFGRIESLPAGGDLLGVWRISGISVTVTSTTELEDERLPFAVGVVVKVEFEERGGVKVAEEIKSFFDFGADGPRGGRYGHAWGTIDSLPGGDGFVGTWRIGGTEYSVTPQTRLIELPQPFAVGQRVKVKYQLNEAGQRVAVRIQTTNGRGGVEDDDSFKFVGTVEEKPAGSLIGRWVIGGEVFTTTTATRFDEDDSLLAVGVWVEVEYRIVAGQRIVKEMESHTPPGCGDRDRMGRVESVGDDSAVAAGVTAGDALWRIGGTTYVVTAATDLDEAGGVLAVGSDAIVNSYTAADGSQVATRIAAIDVVTNIYLPITTR